MTVECTARGPIEAVASDLTYGIAANAPQAPGTIANQDGHVTITRARGKF